MTEGRPEGGPPQQPPGWNPTPMVLRPREPADDQGWYTGPPAPGWQQPGRVPPQWTPQSQPWPPQAPPPPPRRSNTTLWVVLGVVLVLLLAGGGVGFFLWQKSRTASSSAPATVQQAHGTSV